MAQGREVEVKFRRDLGLLEITMIGLVASFYIYGFGFGIVLALKTILGTSSLVLYGLNEGALTKLFAVLAAGVFIGLNYRGTKLTGRSETAVTIALVVVVSAFIIAGLLHLTHTGVPAANFQPFLRGDSGFLQFVSLLGAMGFTFIVFEGYEIIAQTGEEVRHPEKNIPRAHFIVIGLSTLIFILVAFVAIGISGNCNGGPSASCLLLQASPERAVGNNNAVAESADVMFLLLFLMVNWAAIVLRRTMPDVKRYYVMPLFPLIPILGIATKFVLALSLWTIEPIAWVIALGWIGVGLTVHYLHERKEIVIGVTKVVESILPHRRPRYRILLPVGDFERVELVEFGALIAQVEDAELTLLHVIEVPPALPIDAIDRAYVSEVRYHLGKLRRRAEELGAYATARVDVSHKVFDSILDNIREDETDLLILGWKGGWRRGRILGTNVDRFVQEAPCDVVVFKSAGLKPKIERILVMNAPEWHVSYATGYAILLAKKHRAKITILSAVQTDRELEKERGYSARLAEMCRTHGVAFEEKFVKARNIVDTVVEEAKNYDLLALGASTEWRLTQFAFGPMQDQIARRTEAPTLMVRKVRRKEERIPLRSPLPTPAVVPPQPV